MNILEIQQALHAKGFDPGPHDGIMGARTRAAIRKFQAANGLVVDGIVGPITSEKLFTILKPDKKAAAPISVEFPWYVEAWRLLGITEVGGPGDNQVILAWAKDLGIPYSEDETPWCGLFVAHCVGSQLPDEPLPSGPLGARNWGGFGNKVAPQPAAILVFWRQQKNGPFGHVGFYAGEDDSHYHVLGGNQDNKVCVTRIPKDRLLQARWPSTVPAAKGKALKVDAAGLTDGARLH
jgi:uncharacterized protein (TIGR02594 family)